MSLRIRLARGGAKKRPFYRVVIADSRSPRDGRYVEKVGTYNPMVAKDHPDRVTLVEDRIKYWMGVGALPSDRVARMLAAAGLMEKPAIPEQTKKDKPRAKTVERQKEAEEKAKEKEKAAKQAVEEAAAVAKEAPAEETPAEETAAAEAPAEEAATAGEAPAEKAAAEEAPVEEAPTGEEKTAG